MFYVYVLQSETDDGLYIGFTTDLRRRLKEHQEGKSFATSYRGPWKLIYYEAYLDEQDALGRERYLKSGGGRRFLKSQLKHHLLEASVATDPMTAWREALYAADLHACHAKAGHRRQKPLGRVKLPFWAIFSLFDFSTIAF